MHQPMGDEEQGFYQRPQPKQSQFGTKPTEKEWTRHSYLAELSHPELVLSWLRHLPADTVVGYARQPDACPFSSYLHACGYDGVRVGTKHLEWDNPKSYLHPLPAWMKMAIGAIDRQGFNTPITAGALARYLTSLLEGE